jgi:hypothetical protein
MHDSPERSGVTIDSLRRLVIDFHAGTIEIEGADGSCYRLKVAPDSVASGGPLTTDVPPLETTAPPAAESGTQRMVRLVGRLKSTPREGRPDGRGRPTAWAKLAVHEEGRDSARMHSATFHAATTNKVLALPVDAQIIVEGYVRPSDDPRRMDALSVFTLMVPTANQPDR